MAGLCRCLKVLNVETLHAISKSAIDEFNLLVNIGPFIIRYLTS